MRDVFPDEAVDEKPPGETPVGESEAAHIRDGLEGQVVCPFCGVVGDGSQVVCPKCTMENTAIARKATKLRIGPWYVLQNRNPAAPGMKWETLLSFVRKGRVKPQSIVRGPTTHQLWRFAAHVKGLSREFGVCYSCGGSVERAAHVCPHCNRLQEPPPNADTLLEGAESEARLPIYKEISPSQADEPAPEPAAPTISEAELAAARELREKEEALAREQREAIERERQALEQEKAAAAGERELLRREQEAIAREREAVLREKESMEKDRGVLARERDLLRRDREAATAAAREATAARESAIRESTLLRESIAAREAELSREVAALRHASAARETAALRDAAPAVDPAGDPPPRAAAETSSATASAATSDSSVWDMGEPPRQPYRAPLGSRPAEKSPAGNFTGQKSRARDGFLSPRDLAAAFKLNLAADDYDIAAKPSEALAEPEPAMPPGLLSIGQPPAAKKPRGRKKLIVGVMLVAVAGVALALSPELRQKVSGYWADLTDQPIKPPLTGLSKTAGPSKDAADARSNLPDYPPADQPPERATPPALPAAALATTHPAEPAQPPTNWAHVLTSGSVPEGTGSAPGNSPAAAPAVPTPEAPPTPSPEIIELARQTFAKARAAEVRLDYDEAVRQLEKLKSLPRAAWPAEVDVDFQLRLDRNLQSQPK